jgi:serine/threonine protein phosphatase PrpC
VRSALLRGREHLEIGALDLVAEGAAAVAISQGGSPKRYAHTDPNEDCAAFALGSEGLLLAVADGHSGFEAAELLLDHLLQHPAPQWTGPFEVPGPEQWRRHALAALCDANAEILREQVGLAARTSRTTLCLAVALPRRGVLLHASVGDSHLFRVDGRGAVDLSGRTGPTSFLGQREETPDRLATHCRLGMEPLAGTRALVLCSDGLSEKGIGVDDPAAAVAAAVEEAAQAPPPLRPSTLARRVGERALDAQQRHRAGDNVAVAVAWLEGAPPG